jgi:hypothetical protein
MRFTTYPSAIWALLEILQTNIAGAFITVWKFTHIKADFWIAALAAIG